ncbi:MAG: hypothetical protein VW985_06825, partial [Gammaproteobacteria bacterium]
SSLHAFGSDETGQGFADGNISIGFDVNFSSMDISNGFMNVNDAQSRNWNLNQVGSATLENDAFLDMMGSCIGCGGSSAGAYGFIYATFLSPNAEGVLGSFGAQTGMEEGPEAISGVYVGDRFSYP